MGAQCMTTVSASPRARNEFVDSQLTRFSAEIMVPVMTTRRTHQPISDPVLRSLAEWYPTNADARSALARAQEHVSSAESTQSRQAWEETASNLRRLVEVRGGSVGQARVELLVKRHTAFSSLDELAEALVGGYVPTLRTSGTSKRTAEIRELAGALKEAGHRVFEV